jgi:ATP-binding cassette subfamily B protein
MTFPLYLQHDSMDCGPTCLRMIVESYEKNLSLSYLRELCAIDREGVSLKGISTAAEKIGFRTMAVKVKYGESEDEPCLMGAPLPAIAHWNQNHFIVVYKLKRNKVYIADPASGKHVLSRAEFEQSWLSDGDEGILLLLEPNTDFSQEELEDAHYKPVGFGFLWLYLFQFKKLIIQLVLGLLIGTLLQLVFPFLTQAIVDHGIQNKDISFIWLILIGQLFLFAGQTVVRLIQSWIILHIGTRINVNLVSDFLVKLMKLPLSYFDSKQTGDLMQRIGDHRRIENFLTQSLISILTSVFSFLFFGIILAIYHIKIFLIFLISSILYFIWIYFFLRRRKEIDYKLFRKHADNQDNLYEIIQGMAEIKLQGSHFKRRSMWAQTQASLFKVNMRSLALSQYQDVGGNAIQQIKDILITVISATAVIKGEITLGMMISIQFIIGQINGPLQQMIQFLRSAQDAKLSLERLGEIHSLDNEERSDDMQIKDISADSISIRNLSFRYTPISNEVLQNLNLDIPKSKVTAIVGSSGSGKTTLIKILLGFYDSYQGEINIGNRDFKQIHKESWRGLCGAVLQDGYIFSDTIANNIAESAEEVSTEKLKQAVKIANIESFIQDLPLRFNTMIGSKGNGVSQGQKQRLLIARAVYKNPDFFFFDEATNALDAVNEKIISNNLKEFYKDKTVVIVAHRLSTVKHADQIVVLDNGSIAEVGTHQELVLRKGKYFELVSNQLELGEG